MEAARCMAGEGEAEETEKSMWKTKRKKVEGGQVMVEAERGRGTHHFLESLQMCFSCPSRG